MPRRPVDTQPSSDNLQLSLASRLRAGKVAPLISSALCHNAVLGGHTALVEKYRTHIAYPLPGQADLPRLTQYQSVTDDNLAEAWDLGLHYLDFIKNHVFDLAEAAGAQPEILAEVEEEFDDLPLGEFASRLGLPHPGDRLNNPLALLAGFRLPIYLTTSCHGFLEQALAAAGANPHTEICRWHEGLDSLPSVFDGDYEPSAAEPVVYHLHGFDEIPHSLVLTEDHYLEFLVAVSEHRGKDTDRIPDRIRQALNDSALVLLGYSLQDWDFRSLFWGLIKMRSRQPRSVAIQL
ncbi:MAG: SIR2 family protein, partial [Chloroflexota bacterium]